MAQIAQVSEKQSQGRGVVDKARGLYLDHPPAKKPSKH